MAVLGGDARGGIARARLGTPDEEHIPSRDRRRIAVCRIARSRRDQAGGVHSAARAQSIRPGLRHRTSAPRTTDGDDRDLRARGDSAGPGAARGSSGSTERNGEAMASKQLKQMNELYASIKARASKPGL